jgi:hypothetical protein
MLILDLGAFNVWKKNPSARLFIHVFYSHPFIFWFFFGFFLFHFIIRFFFVPIPLISVSKTSFYHAKHAVNFEL